MTSAAQFISDREHHLQHAIDALNIGVAVFRPDCTLAVWNRRYSEMFSFPKQLCREGSAYTFLLKYQVENGRFSGEDPTDSDVQQRVHRRIVKLSDAITLEQNYKHVSGMMIAIDHSFFPDGSFMMVCMEATDGKGRDIWF